MHTSQEECKKWCFRRLNLEYISGDLEHPEVFKRIKAAYRAQAKISHPDVGGTEEEMKEVQFAFDFLTDQSVRSSWTSSNVFDLNKLTVILNSSITFEEAFFGCELHFNYNIEEYDEKGNPTRREKEEVEKLTLYLPPGCFMGYQQLLNEKGFRFKDIRGVTQVNVTVKPSNKYQVDPRTGDIIATEPVDLNMMLSGGKMTVQTMHGAKVLRVPPATAPGSRLIIPGAGFGGAGHHVMVAPLFPTKEELKKDKWSNFKVDWDLQKEIDDEKIEEWKSRFGNNGAGIIFTTTTSGSGTGGF